MRRFDCPHCHQSLIGWWQKINATSVSPARCPQCKGLSHLSNWITALNATAIDIAFWLSVVAAIIAWSWIPLAAFPLALVLTTILTNRKAFLKPIDRDQLSRNRVRAVIQTGMLIACVALLVSFANR
jgi:hypothetical protein